MTAKALKKAVGYVRVSTDNQIGADKYGLDAQRSEIARFAQAGGYIIIKWYEEKGSGASDAREKWNEIIYGSELNGGVIEAVIVFKNDRVARDTKLYFYYLYMLERKNVRLVSTHEQFAEGGDFANIYRALLQFVAEQERKNITLRTKQGRRLKAAKGRYSGGQPPYGYKISNGSYEVVPEEALVVKKIFEMRGTMPVLRIAETLNAAKLNTRSGGCFYASTVKSILNNELTYYGMYRYGKSDAPWVKGEHEPILK